MHSQTRGTKHWPSRATSINPRFPNQDSSYPLTFIRDTHFLRPIHEDNITRIYYKEANRIFVQNNGFH